MSRITAQNLPRLARLLNGYAEERMAGAHDSFNLLVNSAVLDYDTLPTTAKAKVDATIADINAWLNGPGSGIESERTKADAVLDRLFDNVVGRLTRNCK